MQPKTPVEIADRLSRKRAFMVAAATAVFLAVQVIARPFFAPTLDPAQHAKIDMWAINAIALLALLATGGGLVQNRRIRSLVNDEVCRSNYRTAVVAGYWVAMLAALALYFLSRFRNFTARETVYVVVTSSVAVALLTFSYLEYRAHRDA
jgi:magnesium-transporting ATPase (P-type)